MNALSQCSEPSVSRTSSVQADDAQSSFENKTANVQTDPALDDSEAASECSEASLSAYLALTVEIAESSTECSDVQVSVTRGLSADSVQSSSQVSESSVTNGLAIAVGDTQSSSECSESAVTIGLAIAVDDVQSSSQASESAVTRGLAIAVDDTQSSSQASELSVTSGLAIAVDDAQSSSQASESLVTSSLAIAVDDTQSSSQASDVLMTGGTSALEVDDVQSPSQASDVLVAEGATALAVNDAQSSTQASDLFITEGNANKYELNGDPLRIGDNDGSVELERAVLEFSVLDLSTENPVYLKFDIVYVSGVQTGRIRRWTADFPLGPSAIQAGQGDSASRVTFPVTGGRKTLDITDMVVDAKLASEGVLYIEFEASPTNDSKFYEISNSNSSRPSLSYTEGATLDVASSESQPRAEEAGPVILSAGLGVTGTESRSESKRLNIPFYSDVQISVWGNIEPLVIYPVRSLVRPITHE